MKTRPLAKASFLIVFPIRLFHASLLGLLLGMVLTLTTHYPGECLGQSAPATGTTPPATSGTNPLPAAVPAAPSGTATPDDNDGDGIPNAWETRFHHNPNDPADAAADFDNDGLNASQEYQLHTRTGGAAGNPLGNWSAKTLEPPAEYAGLWFYPVAINRHGDVLVQASGGNPYRYISLLAARDGTWTKLASDDKPTWNSYGSDLNDLQQVVGQRYSNDWSTWESFVWDPAGGFKTLQYQGKKAVAYKLNNHGDWMGSIIEPATGEYKQAWVVGGENKMASQDWWPYSWFTDLNDAGEAMGSYYNPCTWKSQTFLAYGSWRFDTGFAGAQPMFDEFSNVWSWASAMNSQGEFTGSAGGLLGNQWEYLGYHFNGKFTPLRFASQPMSYIYPESINSASTIVGYASNYPADEGGFIFRDGIGMFLHQLPLDIAPCDSANINDSGTILATDQTTGKILLISPEQDADGDGMCDDWELFHNLNPDDPSDAFIDSDHDGISNLGEFGLHTDPNVFTPRGASGQLMDTRPGIDTDGDGMPNTWEWANGLDFEDPRDAALDSDRDGFTNLQEYQLNTDPRGAPYFRIREIGPFPDTSYVSLYTCVLGRGQGGATTPAMAPNTLTESAYLYAAPSNTSTQGGFRPAAWSIPRAQDHGSFAFYPAHGSQYLSPIAMADTGAALASHSYNPVTLVYWASPTATPVSIPGTVPSVASANAADVRTLTSARLSPSGIWLAGWRTLHSTGTMQPVLWKMPVNGQISVPMPLSVPAGLTLTSGTPLQVNDLGGVIATAMQGGYNRAVLWKLNASGQPSPNILPPHPGGTWSSACGLSNTASPVVAGSATLANGQRRATVWSSSGMPVDLGALDSGNDSYATMVSPSGLVAGIARVWTGTGYACQSFLAKPAPPTSPTPWKIFAQGPAATSVSHTALTDSGELLGSAVPVSRQSSAPTLWRLGCAYPLDSILPASSGYTLISILGLNPNGTLLVSAWRGSYQARLLLTPDADTDGDGLPDAYENLNHFNPYRAQAATTDSDGDGLADLLEYRHGTDPRRPDSDGDGMPDAWEIQWGFNPLSPADAAADADGDHVSNLREAQLGTNPVGVFRSRILYTDKSNTYPYPCAFDDSGRVVISQSQYTSIILANGWQSSTGTTTSSLLSPDSAQFITQLPVTAGYSFESSPTYAQYNSNSSSLTCRLDAATGAVHGQVCQSRYSYNGQSGQSSESRCLIPDMLAPSAAIPATWISWESIKTNLVGTTGSLNPYPQASSPDGSRSLYQDTAGSYYLLDPSGKRIGNEPPASSAAAGRYYWQLLNSQGHALATQCTYLPTANGAPPGSKYVIYFWNGVTVTTIPTPDAWNVPSQPSSIFVQSLSEDGLALIQRGSRNPDGSYSYESHLLNLATQSFTRVATPGMGYESILVLSSRNGRMIGYGNQPFMVTPGGTCVRLESLRLRNSTTEQSLASQFPNSLNPRHITSDGRITFTTTDASGRQLIVQLSPNQDLNNNGIPDDWEKHWAALCLATLGETNLTPAELAMLRAGSLDPNARIAGCDLTVMQIYQASGVAGSGLTPQGDAALYTVELEVTRESRRIGSGVGFVPLDDPENTTTRFLGFEEESRLTIKNSPDFTANADNLLISLTKSTFLEGGRILDECKTTTTEDPAARNWEETHRKTLPLTQSIEWGPRVDTNLNEISQTLSKSGSGSATPWRLKDAYGHTLATGTEVIERTTLTRLTEGRTIQDIFEAMNACSPWETATEVHRYSPSGYASQLYSTCSKNPASYDKAVQAVRKEYEDGVQLSERIADADVAWISWHAYANRLKGIRYRWLKFNPAAPFAHFPTPPPATYSQRMSLLLTRDRYKCSGLPAASTEHPLYHESKIIGVESLVFKGGSSGWTDADISPIKDAKYRITTPDDLPAASYDPATNASTSVLTQPVKLNLAVDANHDGLITFDGKDETSAEKPYRFWQNDNQDEQHDSWGFGDSIPETIPAEKHDCDDLKIQSTRDLQDFARLKVQTTLPQDKLALGELQIGLKWMDLPPLGQSDGFPTIRLFQAVEQDGGLQYLKTPEFARRQVEEKGWALTDASGIQIVNGFISLLSPNFTFSTETVSRYGNCLNLLFEGCVEGKGRLAIVIMNRDGIPLGEGSSVWLEIKNIEHMYMRAHTTPPITAFPDPYNIFKDESPTPPAPYSYKYVDKGTNVNSTLRGHYGLDIAPSAIGWSFGFDVEESYIPFVPAPDEEKKCVFFVHGINMSVPEVKAYSAAFYKRLWWEGYRGRLAAFRWPTKRDTGPGPDILYIDIFNTSEYRSWTAGSALKQYVSAMRNGLGNDWIFGLAAHSLGNVCATSALRQGMVVDNYVMLEAALSTSCLYGTVPAGTSDPLIGHFHPTLANADGTDTVKPTPYDCNDLGYRGYLKDIKQGVKRKITNYHNDSDFWLATGRARHEFPSLNLISVDWVSNQAKYKPNGYKNYNFYPIHDPGTGGHTSGRPVVSAHESMSFVSRSRTRPMGSELPVASSGIPVPPFDIRYCASVDLKNSYNFTKARSNHSGQFMREMYELYTDTTTPPFNPFRVPFFRQLMSDLGALPEE